ncbi:MAG: sulfotransferase [Pseudomonadota bacterium]
MTDTLPFQPVIILGAARSGTNMLRDILCQFNACATWPCDEINAIWRHGNLQWPNDQMPAHLARPEIRQFIRKAFIRQWRQAGKPPVLIEKTCANTLRVPFVNAVFPEATYIHILRNGLDVIASAERRWNGQFELPILHYYLAKLRNVPRADLPHYALAFLENRAKRVLQPHAPLKIWGPQCADIQVDDISIAARCERQWAACVTQCADALGKLPAHKIHQVRYEDLTANPLPAVIGLTRFLNVPAPEAEIKSAIAMIRPPRKAQRHTIAPTLQAPMKRFGYI